MSRVDDFLFLNALQNVATELVPRQCLLVLRKRGSLTMQDLYVVLCHQFAQSQPLLRLCMHESYY
jgi:hypothetical protein